MSGEYTLEQVVGTIVVTDQYRRWRYHQAARVAAALAGVLVATLIGTVFLVSKPVRYQYVLVETDGRIARPVPLDRPNVDDDAVRSWATDAITKIYTFDFKNYRQQFQSATLYLTHFGMEQFKDSLQKSGNFTSIVENRYVLTAAPTGPAKITWKGAIPLETGGSRYGWKVEIPIVITYRSSMRDITQRLTVSATVGRMPERSTDGMGLGIRQIVAQ